MDATPMIPTANMEINYGKHSGSAAGAITAASSSYGNPQATAQGTGRFKNPIKRRKLVMTKPGNAKSQPPTSTASALAKALEP